MSRVEARSRVRIVAFVSVAERKLRVYSRASVVRSRALLRRCAHRCRADAARLGATSRERSCPIQKSPKPISRNTNAMQQAHGSALCDAGRTLVDSCQTKSGEYRIDETCEQGDAFGPGSCSCKSVPSVSGPSFTGRAGFPGWGDPLAGTRADVPRDGKKEEPFDRNYSRA